MIGYDSKNLNIPKYPSLDSIIKLKFLSRKFKGSSEPLSRDFIEVQKLNLN